ncbi:MAG: PAS domain S-box protein [Nitrospirae bacterium]|nr:MAG: PAS domain S-box protein [Nitrospirota bacterium]
MKILTNFSDVPIERKLFLISAIPMLALLLVSLVTFRSVNTFSYDEDRLNHIYHVQTAAAEYMKLIVDLETGFRGFVLTREPQFLQPYHAAKARVLSVGSMLRRMVLDVEAQKILVDRVQRLVETLIREKDELIESVKAGNPQKALHYIEQGRGRNLMSRIREEMANFDRREMELLRNAMESSAHDRTLLMSVVIGGGAVALVLMMVPLHFIARSITGPLTALAQAFSHADQGVIPTVPIFHRRDEIGELTRVMDAMNQQLRAYVQQIQRSEQELRIANANLAASEAKYRAIVDHAPIGIFTTEGMRLVFCNGQNWRLAGWNPEEQRDPERFWEAIHPDDRSAVCEAFRAAYERSETFERVFRLLTPNGTIRQILCKAVPLKGEDGQTICYQGFNVDITALEQMRAQLSRAERLVTLGQVAAGIAHEIRNPLVGIGSTASLLIEDMPENDPRLPDLQIILRETQRLDRIVSQIVEYARPRELTCTPISLSELIEETIAILKDLIVQKVLHMELTVDPHSPPIQADRDQLKQVLLNAIHNAIDAVPDGGRIAIRVKGESHGEREGALIEIEDTGKGISPADLPRIFEPFFTSGKRRGTGLGLAISRNIIEAHGGEIHIRSEIGVGTIMTVWLPLVPQPQLVPV